jgi:chromosome segregation ATPase
LALQVPAVCNFTPVIVQAINNKVDSRNNQKKSANDLKDTSIRLLTGVILGFIPGMLVGNKTKSDSQEKIILPQKENNTQQNNKIIEDLISYLNNIFESQNSMQPQEITKSLQTITGKPRQNFDECVKQIQTSKEEFDKKMRLSEQFEEENKNLRKQVQALRELQTQNEEEKKYPQQQNIKQIEEENNQLKDQILKKDQAVSELQEKNKELEQFQEDNENSKELKESNEKLNKQIQEIREQNRNLQNQLSELTTRTQSLGQEKDQTVSEFREKIISLSNKNQNLNNEISELKNFLNFRQITIKKFEEQFIEAIQELKKMTENSENLESSYDNIKNIVESINKMLNNSSNVKFPGKGECTFTQVLTEFKRTVDAVHSTNSQFKKVNREISYREQLKRQIKKLQKHSRESEQQTDESLLIEQLQELMNQTDGMYIRLNKHFGNCKMSFPRMERFFEKISQEFLTNQEFLEFLNEYEKVNKQGRIQYYELKQQCSENGEKINELIQQIKVFNGQAISANQQEKMQIRSEIEQQIEVLMRQITTIDQLIEKHINTVEEMCQKIKEFARTNNIKIIKKNNNSEKYQGYDDFQELEFQEEEEEEFQEEQ